jgi:aquaporin Z
MITSLKSNWRVYSMEAICLGLFMISACVFATLLEFPQSVVHRQIPNDFLRLVVMGLVMGITNVLLVYSPMGKLSGAHMNPAVTLTFFGLGKVKKWDAVFYVLFQLLGGTLAVVLMDIILGTSFEKMPVSYVVTVPGRYGTAVAFWTEIAIAFFMMLMVLVTTNHEGLSRYTGYIAGCFVCLYIIITAPISGFSMNPARTLASAIPSNIFTDLWVYLTAPFLGMFCAALLYTQLRSNVICAKIFHCHHFPCIFNCGYRKCNAPDK